MKINSLEINGYKNLNDIQLAFEEHSAVNAIIGNNGSGKSNILEAIVKIFSSVISNEELEFVFDIRYSIDNAHYQITNKENKFIFTKDGKTVKKQEIFTSIPLGIFLYYCGETDRLLKLSNDFVDEAFNKALKDHDEVVLKYLSFIELKDCFPFWGRLTADEQSELEAAALVRGVEAGRRHREEGPRRHACRLD